MNNQRSIQTRLGRSVAAAVVVLGALWSAPAYAVAPANTTVTNTATLTYTGNATGIAASVDFKVTLRPAAPGLGSGPIGGAGVALSLTGPGDNTVVAGQGSVATYIISANSNGPDTYNLTGPATPTSLTGGDANATYKDVGNATITSVTLGATAAAAAGAGPTITVPADGVANNSVNGIVVNDYVAINGVVYQVTAVADNITGTSTLTLDSSIVDTFGAAATVAVGDLIGEVQEFTMNLTTVGLVSGAGPLVSVTTTATSVADNAQTASDAHVTNVTEVTFTKYVRNVNTSVVGTGAYPDPIGGATFYTGAVTAKSGEVVEYLLLVTNPAGTTAVAGASITDAVPTFTTYVASSTRLNGITVAGDGAGSPVAAGLTIDDNTGRTAAAVASGAIASGSSATVTFQVTVD